MSQSPLQHTRFEIAVEEGHQFTENAITRVRLLISITDASRQWVGWYAFLEELPEPGDRACAEHLIGVPRCAQETIQFGSGTFERATIELRRARTVDDFVNKGRERDRTARIHDARYDRPAKTQALQAGASGPQRLDIAIGFDLFAGRERETVRANVGVLSLARPRGSIHPALGYLVFLRRERCAKARPAAGAPLEKAALSPVW
jgi:hypothetical protein